MLEKRAIEQLHESIVAKDQAEKMGKIADMVQEIGKNNEEAARAREASLTIIATLFPGIRPLNQNTTTTTDVVMKDAQKSGT